MKIWVAGASGLLGSTMRNRAHLATDRKEVDIANLENLRAFARANPGITHMINCAAFSLVDLAETKKEEAFSSNVIGPENLAVLAKELKARFIHISSDYVFQGDLHRPLKETDETLPCSYYGYTKLEGEKRAIAILPSCCVIRTSWLFGKGGKNFVAALFSLLQEKEEIRLTDDQWGRPTYAPDLAEAIWQMLDASGLYQFANQGAVTKYQFGIAMKEEAEALGIPLAVKRLIPVPSSTFASLAKRPRYSVFDTQKIESKLLFPIRSWQEALREYLRAICYAPV